ncbi:endopeptidase La [Rickettsia endosymbiont of Cardiosporidium cionae]|uniref:endopeptidase La n=1 Tax=Rickettsia endosymbiont of Cardiosporidium cionae TaxID=2777155 RepID=UPI00189499E8|nr:endopeptidase La [Rickettsia endosymbiont of Cardiosporidium cionae]KAF8818992.1 endopeptidase La [Rickettsia endosymbiont of Cardiosporidium cionae]
MYKQLNKLPLIVLKDIVVFPKTVVSVLVKRSTSVRSIELVQKDATENSLLLTTQKEDSIENPGVKDLYNIGVVARVIQIIELPGKNIKILVEAIQRVKLLNITIKSGAFLACYSLLNNTAIVDHHESSLILSVLTKSFKEYLQLNKGNLFDNISFFDTSNAEDMIYLIVSCLKSPISMKQEILEVTNIDKQCKLLNELVIQENIQIHTEQSIQQRIKKQVEKTQKEFYLNEQLKAIQQELEGEDKKSDFTYFQQMIDNTKLSPEAKEKAESELKKLKSIHQFSAESSIVKNYLETLLSMPWKKVTKTKINLLKTEQKLHEAHYGLDKIKERILEYLAVLKRSNKIKGPIICFIGPSGVGKTSLVKSIANAMGRKYTKFALGGVDNESEIRGHRRTYLGSMPGKIITLLKKAKVDNPVMLLDEIDKMCSNFRGDPASALLEVLDPEQNSSFVDHYLEVEYDLSNIVFVATANSYNIPLPLLDRIEIIDISGYLEEEKLQIAKHHLIAKQLKIHSLKNNELLITDESIIDIIRFYTKESGVRELERVISKLARKSLVKILNDKALNKVQTQIVIEAKDLESYLGIKKYKFGLAKKNDTIAMVTALAYTNVGGDLLSIEAVSLPGKGNIKATGSLGDVMKESADTAYSCFLSRAKDLGVSVKDYKNIDIHLHVPEGAIPKDGPSAGIAIFTTIVSLMTKRYVKKNVAMTGEITLHGQVLAIGGLKEKLLAATRGGIDTVLIPEDNMKDLQEIPKSVKDQLNIIAVSEVEQIIELAIR